MSTGSLNCPSPTFVFFFQMPAWDFPGGRGLNLRAPNSRGLGLIPGQGATSYMLQLKPSAARLKHACARVCVRVSRTSGWPRAWEIGEQGQQKAPCQPLQGRGPLGLLAEPPPHPASFLRGQTGRERRRGGRGRQADTWSRRWRLFCRAAQAHRNQQSPSSPCFTCPSCGLPANSRGVAQIS